METLTKHESRGVFEGMGDGLLIASAATEVILEATPAFCRLLGYAREELTGRHPNSFLHSASQRLYAARVRAVQAGSSSTGCRS